jgi:hypothetical protein
MLEVFLNAMNPKYLSRSLLNPPPDAYLYIYIYMNVESPKPKDENFKEMMEEVVKLERSPNPKFEAPTKPMNPM